MRAERGQGASDGKLATFWWIISRLCQKDSCFHCPQNLCKAVRRNTISQNKPSQNELLRGMVCIISFISLEGQTSIHHLVKDLSFLIMRQLQCIRAKSCKGPSIFWGLLSAFGDSLVTKRRQAGSALPTSILARAGTKSWSPLALCSPKGLRRGVFNPAKIRAKPSTFACCVYKGYCRYLLIGYLCCSSILAGKPQATGIRGHTKTEWKDGPCSKGAHSQKVRQETANEYYKQWHGKGIRGRYY